MTYSVKQVSELTGVTTRYIYQLIAHKKLKSQNIGSMRVIRDSDIVKCEQLKDRIK
jgi:excisionase family DNA binding protein